MRSSFGDTTGTVSIVLAIAISSSAVNVSLVMMPLSSRMLAKMIMISAFVCSSHPMIEASPRSHLRSFPAIYMPTRQIGYGTVKMIPMAIRKTSVVLKVACMDFS
jgi:hypothetical protein